MLEHAVLTGLRFVRWVAIWYILWTLAMMLSVAIGYVVA